MNHLQSKGVRDLYVSSDQATEVQQRRVSIVLLELLEAYSSLINVA
jgi:hypothetical protein